MALLSNDECLSFLGAASAISAGDNTLVALLRPMGERLVKEFVGYTIEQETFTEYYPQREESQTHDAFVDGWEMVSNQAMAYSGGSARGRILPLRNLPVRSITTIHEYASAWNVPGGHFPPETLLQEGTDYFLDWETPGRSWTGFVFRRSGSWLLAPRCIKVVYTAGLTTAELRDNYPDFKLAALQTVAKLFNEAKTQQGYAKGQSGVGPVVSESLADWSATYATTVVAEQLGLQQTLPLSARKLLEPYVRMSKFLPV